ncbi:MAG: FadR/GntR family transcriptional regulator [Blautia sp.]
MSNLFEGRNKRESAVDIVVNNIKQLLMERKLKPGDRLPSELEISEGLCVSRGSVREAMKILSAFGLIDIRVGNGTYVCESIGNGIMDSFLFSFFLSNPDVENLFELRRLFEIDIMELIDKHYSENEEERIALRKNLKELESIIKNGASPKELAKNDIEFHQLFGKATHNILVERIYNLLWNLWRPPSSPHMNINTARWSTRSTEISWTS